jgi:hypothetical protein
MLSNLFITGDVKLFIIVSVTKVTVTEIRGIIKFMLVEMAPQCKCENVIGELTYVKMDCKRQLSRSASDNCPVPTKQLCADEVRNLFRESKFHCNDKSFNAEPSNVIDTVTCENCNNHPCEWTKYGPEIIPHLNNNYLGYFMDEDGNVVDELTRKASIITNCQLQFLAYSAFTSMKHHYLGKKKCLPLPYCIQCGIRVNFPDDHNYYVGFRYAEDEK